jgi:hypothetical protein
MKPNATRVRKAPRESRYWVERYLFWPLRCSGQDAQGFRWFKCEPEFPTRRSAVDFAAELAKEDGR